MRFYDYCDAINAQVEVTRYACQSGRWSAHFYSCEIKERSMLTSAHGNGKSPEEAIRDYIKQIEGQRIVFNAMSKEMRREFDVPTGLEP